MEEIRLEPSPSPLPRAHEPESFWLSVVFVSGGWRGDPWAAMAREARTARALRARPFAAAGRFPLVFLPFKASRVSSSLSGSERRTVVTDF